jgi:hypothetical protein
VDRATLPASIRAASQVSAARPEATAEDVRRAAREIDECFTPWYDQPVSSSERQLLTSQLPGAESRALERLRQLFPGLE